MLDPEKEMILAQLETFIETLTEADGKVDRGDIAEMIWEVFSDAEIATIIRLGERISDRLREGWNR